MLICLPGICHSYLSYVRVTVNMPWAGQRTEGNAWVKFFIHWYPICACEIKQNWITCVADCAFFSPTC